MEKLNVGSRGGIILGVMKTMIPYQGDTVTVGKNDVLLLFTDGVSEAMDINGQEYGEERLEKIAIESLCLPPDAILSNIVNSVKEHSKGTTQSDDITMIVELPVPDGFDINRDAMVLSGELVKTVKDLLGEGTGILRQWGGKCVISGRITSWESTIL